MYMTIPGNFRAYKPVAGRLRRLRDIFFVSCIWLLLFCPLYSAQWWDLRFTDGSIDTAIENMLENYILGASSMVYLANYSTPSGSTKITTSMNNRDSAGLDVKYVGDGDYGNYTGLNAHIPFRLDPSGNPIMHNKFLIVDPVGVNRLMITGSGNYTSGGWGSQNSSWLTIIEPQIINVYLDKFNQMFNGSFHNTRAATPSATTPLSTANGTAVYTLFSPEDGPWKSGHIVCNTIGSANESVFFETTGHDESAAAVLDFDQAIWAVLDSNSNDWHNFLAEGVVNNMGGNSSSDFTGTALSNYNAKGAYIRQAASTGFDHHHEKYVVVDMEWVGVGSMNASNSSSQDMTASGSDENHIFINDFRLARAFMKEFGRRYQINGNVGSVDNTSVTEIHDWTAPDAPSGLIVTPNTNTFAVLWTAPANPGDFSRYYVYISTNNNINTAKNETIESDGSVHASPLRPEMQKKGIAATSAALTTCNEGDAVVQGTNYYIGVVSVDKFGNESAAVTGGPYLPGLDSAPNNPAALGQFKSNGTTVIPEAGTTTQTTVKFKATVSDPDGGAAQVKLRIELKPKVYAFDGTGLIESGYVATGTQVTITTSSLANNHYHWRAVAVDTCSVTSSWVEFGSSGNTDFTLDATTPAMSWTGAAGYVSDGLNPETGASTTTFNFRVKYTDADNDSPADGYPKVHIKKGGAEISGSPFAMSFVSGDYNTGAIYAYSSILSTGANYSYYFEAKDLWGAAAAGVSTAPINGPVVSAPPNSPPAISWTNEVNYVSDGLNPEAGGTTTYFVYRVKYTDPDNDSPAGGYPKVHIKKGGAEISGSPFAMSVAGPVNYSTGAIYAYSTALSSGADYSYYFEAKDAWGAIASGASTASINAPSVTAQSAVLAWTGEANYLGDGLNPETGDPMVNFTYRVKYTDVDNNAPASGYPVVHIKKSGSEISGSPFAMGYVSGNYNTGAIYAFSTPLPAGTDYSYYFEAKGANNVAATGEPASEIAQPAVHPVNQDEYVKIKYSGEGENRGYFNPAKGGAVKIGFNVSAAGEVDVKIFSLNGRLVREFSKNEFLIAPDYVTWNGTNDSEEIIASGIYVVKIKGPGLNKTEKICVMK
jgi:hypothetical protein